MDEITRKTYLQMIDSLRNKSWVREEVTVPLPKDDMEEGDEDYVPSLTMFSYLLYNTENKFFYLYHEKVDVTKEGINGTTIGIKKEKVTLVIQDEQDRERELLVSSPTLYGFYVTSFDVPELEDLYLHASGVMKCLK